LGWVGVQHVVGWVGLGLYFGGLGWVGFQKVDPCPCLASPPAEVINTDGVYEFHDFRPITRYMMSL